MERSLLFLSFALGGAVWVCGALTTGLGRQGGRASAYKLPTLWFTSGVILPVLVFLATLSARPPVFAEGHGLGTGFLIGGLLGLLAVLTILKALGAADQGQPVSSAAAIAAPVGLALMASITPALWMRGSLLDGLCGIAIGWLCATLISIRGLAPAGPLEYRPAVGVSLALSAGAAVLFCSLVALGELHGLIDLIGKSTAIVHWDGPGMAFASCIAVLLLLALLPPQLTLRIPLMPLITGWIERGRDSSETRASARRGWRLAFCALVVLLIGKIVATRFAERGDALWKTKSPLLKGIFGLLGPNPMFHVIALGVITTILVSWLVRDHYREEVQASAPLSLRPTSVLAVLTLVAASMISFQLMGGFGLGLLLTVLLLAAGLTGASSLADLHELADGEEAIAGSSAAAGGTFDAARTSTAVRETFALSSQMIRLLLLGTILLLYRLFTTRFESEIRGVGLTDHYALFGLLFGAVLPPFLMKYMTRRLDGDAGGDGTRLFRLAVTGLLVLLLPTIIISLWGVKCALALLIGLALSTVFEGSILSALLALALTLAMTQWAHHLLPLAQLTRDQKVTFLFWTTGVTIAALLLSEFAGRRRSSTGNIASAPTTGGAK